MQQTVTFVIEGWQFWTWFGLTVVMILLVLLK